MAKYGSASIGFLLADGFNLLASKIFELTGPEDEGLTEQSNGLGDAWDEHLGVGVRRATMSQNGLYDDASKAVNEVFSGQEATQRVVCLSLEGNTIGTRFIGMAGAFGAKFKRAAQRAGLTKAAVDYTLTGAVEQGVILQPLAVKSVTWNTEGAESVDHGASTAAGGAGYLQVGDVVGFTSLVAKVRHSADDVTYADLLTFTTVTAANRAERVEVAGTVNRHLAISGTLTGTSAQVMGGFARG